MQSSCSSIIGTGQQGEIRITAREEASVGSSRISEQTARDALPKARAHLFTAFKGGARKKGGRGAGVSPIATENWARSRAARLELSRDGRLGQPCFTLTLPKAMLFSNLF